MSSFVAFRINDDALISKDVSEFRKVCSPTLPADQLKSYRGKCMILFPTYVNDSREVWTIPEARRYIQTVDREFRHWPYFVVPDIKHWQLMLWLVCVIEVRIQNAGIQYDREEAIVLLISRLESIRDFCATISDEYAPVAASILAGIQEDLASEVRSRLGK